MNHVSRQLDCQLYTFVIEFIFHYITSPNTLDLFPGPLWLNRCQMFDALLILVFTHVYSKPVSLPPCIFHRAAEQFVFYGSVFTAVVNMHSFGWGKKERILAGVSIFPPWRRVLSPFIPPSVAHFVLGGISAFRVCVCARLCACVRWRVHPAPFCLCVRPQQLVKK